jgi:TIR domain
MKKVFISYSHTDTSIADGIAAVLQELSLDYFRDVKDIQWGDGINNSVREGLESSSAIIVIVSPGSLKSHWVPYEVGYATALKKKILPFLTHPALDVPGFIADLSYVKSEEQVRNFFELVSNQKSLATNSDVQDKSISKPKIFNELSIAMSDLFSEMKSDLSSSENKFVREFVTLDGGVMFTHGGKLRFEYRSNVHPHLFNQVDILESYGFVKVVLETNTKIYRMTEEFVDLLLS